METRLLLLMVDVMGFLPLIIMLLRLPFWMAAGVKASVTQSTCDNTNGITTHLVLLVGESIIILACRGIGD
jgi:hypothetical protein